MQCRPFCAACCIEPSISSPIPGMPEGKPAGVRCIQLNELDQCMLFNQPERPLVCSSIQPSTEMCGNTREAAIQWLKDLEAKTA